MEPLEEGCFYHIYNRGNNKQKVFFEAANYYYFFKLIQKHLLSAVKIYSFCLLPNHFHLLVQVKDEAKKPSQKFSNLFNAYTKAVNIKYDRSGNLFQRTFKRKRIENELYLKNVIIYIHLNPKYSSFSKDYKDYPFSSYTSIFNNKYSFLERKEVLELFGGVENFQFAHEQRKNVMELKADSFSEEEEWRD